MNGNGMMIRRSHRCIHRNISLFREMEREHTYLEFPQDVLGHVIFSDRVHHEALVANRAIRRPVLMAFFLKK